MSLLPTKRYSRIPQQQPELVASALPEPVQPFTVIDILQRDESELNYQLGRIEEAKRLEPELRQRLNVVQQSLQAFRALEAVPEPIQEVEGKVQLPVTQEKRVRKAATKNSGKPTQRSIAPEPTISDTENIKLVHDDFATFPE
jgi:hypothetical protein